MRQAILNANVNLDPNEIDFAILPNNSSVKTINLNSPLPTITNPVAINGLSQGVETNCGTALIELNGTNAGASADGLTVTADNVLVQGLIINRFGSDGVFLSSSSSSTIKCNRIGTNSAGNAASANDDNGIFLSSSSQNFITQNTISGNSGTGLRLNNSSNNVVQNNIIGLDIRQNIAITNAASGIVIVGISSGNRIGGTTAGQGNVISGNTVSGLTISGASASNNSLKGNFIGVDSDGLGTTFDNGGPGILITSSAVGNLVGGTETGAGNIIAQNFAEGVSISSTAGTNNRILGNSIFANRDLGIDLGAVGVTANDAGDPDLANNLQNYPVITGAGTNILGTFNSTANTQFTIQFFLSPAADASGFGEGQTFLGAINLTTNGSGNATFTFVPPIALPANQFVSATATN